MSRLATPLSVLAIAGASIALVACGSSDSSSGGGASTNASGGNGTQNAAFEKYRQCLKDNGVTLLDRGQRPSGGYGPPPGTGTNGAPPTGTDGTPPAGGPGFGGGQPDAKTQKAMEACAKLRPQGQLRGGYGNGGQRPQQDIKAFTPYLTCLKGQGLDVKVSDGFNALRDLKASNPKVQAAFKACQSKLPQRPNGDGQQQTTTSGSST
jgi:hypothetical protein